MLQIAPGEIRLLEDTEIITEEKVKNLGASALEQLQQLGSHRDYRIGISSQEERSGLTVSGDAGSYLDEVLERYVQLLQPIKSRLHSYGHWLILGTFGENIPWHTDTPGDIRFMLNLGTSKTHVDIATEWDPRDYYPGDPSGIEPRSHHALEIEPGQAYVSNTLVSSNEKLPPHQTPVDQTRLVLRTSIYLDSDWRDMASGEGVTLDLAI